MTERTNAVTKEQMLTRLAVIDDHYKDDLFRVDWPPLGKRVHDSEINAIRSLILASPAPPVICHEGENIIWSNGSESCPFCGSILKKKTNDVEDPVVIKGHDCWDKPAPPISKEREEMDAWLGVLNVYGGNDQVIRGHWTVEDSDMVDNLRALILASPVSPKVSRANVREWANLMTNAADHYKSLTSDQFIALCEDNENYLTARLQEKGIAVIEPERKEEKP